MIVIADGFEIHEEWRMAVEAKRRRGDERALKAVAFALTQGALRRPRRVSVLIRECVKKFLDSLWCFEGTQLTGVT